MFLEAEHEQRDLSELLVQEGHPREQEYRHEVRQGEKKGQAEDVLVRVTTAVGGRLLQCLGPPLSSKEATCDMATAIG